MQINLYSATFVETNSKFMSQNKRPYVVFHEMYDTGIMNHIVISRKSTIQLHHNGQKLRGGKKTDFCYQCKETFLLTKK